LQGLFVIDALGYARLRWVRLGRMADGRPDAAGIEGEPKVVEPRRRFSVREFLESQFTGLFPKLEFHPGVRMKYLMAF